MCRTHKSLTLSVLIFSVLFVSFTPTPGYTKKKKRRDKGPSLPALAEHPSSELSDTSPLHSIYSSDLLTAAITTKGRLLVLPKTTGKSTGQIKPFAITFALERKLDKDDDKPKTRKVTAFTNQPEPSINPNTVTIQREHVDGTQVSITYTFSEDEVTAEGVYEDPSKLKPSSRLEYTARIPASHNFPPEMTVGPRKKALAGFEISAKGKTIPYTEIGGFGSGIESASIVGQWPGRTVKFSFKKAGVRLHHYKSIPLYEGFSLRGHTETKSSGKCKVTVSVK